MPIDALEPHPLVRLLGKRPSNFTADDLVRVVDHWGLRQVNLRYVAGDGRLKTLAFPINSRDHLRETLTRGERIDASSAFPDADADASDVYAVPRHRTAFLNPFGVQRSLDVLCSLYAEDGRPLSYAREQVLRRASAALTAESGMTLEVFGELEYYLVEDRDVLFPLEPERGYQESGPFAKGQQVREQVMGHLNTMGISLKYAHGEVGNILEDHRQLAQHEIELQPMPLEQAADALVIAKWVVREVAHAHGAEATFAPSVSSGGAGNGLHVHSRLVRDGVNTMVDRDGINDTARRLIAGYLTAARALSALGNRVPTSFLRFSDGEEAPDAICWGERDRTGLVRVPLAWTGDVLPTMLAHANPSEDVQPAAATDLLAGTHPQTIELRLADGSADVHLLLAGMAVAARHGLAATDSLDQATRMSTKSGTDFEALPSSCTEAADALEAQRSMFEADDVFPASLVDALLRELRTFDADDDPSQGASRQQDLIRRHWHIG